MDEAEIDEKEVLSGGILKSLYRYSNEHHDLVFPAHEISFDNHINYHQSGTHARQPPSGSSGGAIAFIRRSVASGARSHQACSCRTAHPGPCPLGGANQAHLRSVPGIFRADLLGTPSRQHIIDNLYGTPSLWSDSGRTNLVSPFLDRA